jgi:alpha-L-rhamnosidase
VAADDMLMIPSFTLVWISELYEHSLHSGEPTLFRQFQDTVWDIISKALARKEKDYTLYRSLDNPKTWNFCEWTPHLSRLDEFPQSVYNLYLYEAMISASRLYSQIGNQERSRFLADAAAALGRCIEQTFWDEENSCYTSLLPGKIPSSEHVQALMLYNGLVPEEKVERVFKTLCSRKLIPLSYNALAYYVRGLMAGDATMRAAVEPFLQQQFEGPVLSGATSLWETAFGGDDFCNAGSLCHAWSSIHAYYAKRYLLGVAPLEPGYRCFEVKPYAGAHYHAEGAVPTPHGFITVSWTRNGDGLDLEIRHPAGLKPIVASYPEFPLNTIRCVEEPLIAQN